MLGGPYALCDKSMLCKHCSISGSRSTSVAVVVTFLLTFLLTLTFVLLVVGAVYFFRMRKGSHLMTM